MSYGLGAVYVLPRSRNGTLERGVLSTNAPAAVYEALREPRRWIICFAHHHAAVPPRSPYVHLYQIDPYFANQAPRPQVFVTFRDFTDPNQFHPLPDVEKKYDIFLNACWLPLKRPDLVLNAMVYSANHGRPLTCLIAAYHWGPAESSIGTSPKLEQRIRDRAVKEKLDVTFPETCWDSTVVNRWYNESRVAVLPSKSEAGPRVLPEANLAGIPYLGCSDVVGGSRAYINGRNGLLFHPRPDSLAQAIHHALDHPEQFQTRQWALENMCKPVALQRMREALRKLGIRHSMHINLDDLDGSAGTPNDWWQPIKDAGEMKE